MSQDKFDGRRLLPEFDLSALASAWQVELM